MITKRAVLFTTFGTMRAEVMEPILDRLISEGADRWPDRWIEAAITGEHIRRELEKQGVVTEALEEILDRLSDEGFVEVTVQPLMINDGGEYEKIRRRLQSYVNKTIKSIKLHLGRPLLWSHDDMDRLAEVLCRECDPSRKTVYVAHGTGGASDVRYGILERKFRDCGRMDIEVRTMKELSGLEEGVIRKPLMLTAGSHAEEFQCERIGLGELPGIRSIFLDHAAEAQPIRRNTSPLEVLVLAEDAAPMTMRDNNLGLDETRILACRDMRQALMVQELQAQELLPECELEIVEGALENVLAMIDDEGYAGVICGYGELKSLGLEHRARAIFTVEEIVPAIGAGSVNLMEGKAMQAFSDELELGPESITSVYAEGDEDGLELWALYYDEESGQWWTDWIVGDPAEPELSGREFARQICQGGQWLEDDEEDWEE